MYLRKFAFYLLKVLMDVFIVIFKQEILVCRIHAFEHDMVKSTIFHYFCQKFY